jgi:competence protein ComEA
MPEAAVDNPTPWRVLDGANQPATRDGQPAPASGLTNHVAIVAALIGAVAIAGVSGYLVLTNPGGSAIVSGGPIVEGSGDPTAGGPEIVVEVSGAVRSPGVYRLPPTARVADAIDAAGGYGPRVDAVAATAALDLAAHLSDGATVSVPSRDDPTAPPGGGGTGATARGGLINLNTATVSELDSLPGIGPVTARKIIDAREERPFSSIDELRERGVVGEKTFERLRELVTVG